MITGDIEDIKQQRYMYIVATSYGPNLMGSRPGAPRGYVYTGPGGSLRWPSFHRAPDGPPLNIIRYIDCRAPPKFYVSADFPHTLDWNRIVRAI